MKNIKAILFLSLMLANVFTYADVPIETSRARLSTQTGMFVHNGILYDSNGIEFRIRGVNHLHWDNNSTAGITNSGANTVRWVIDFTRPVLNNVSLIQTSSINNKQIPIIGNWDATCKSDTASLDSIVSTWVSQASGWTKLNKYLIVNIANEWGPSDSTVWRDSYISAIAKLRAAGYTGPLLIDSGGCGQDEQDLLKYSAAVFNSDPHHNVMFALHMYGNTNDYSSTIKSVQQGNPTVITLNSNSPTHPFAPSFTGDGSNSYSGITAYQISGVTGMTNLNGKQPAPQNVGGNPGAWTVTLSVDSTNWPAYTGRGTIVDYWGNYHLKAGRLSALAKTTGAVYIIGEFGPGRNIGPSPTMVTPDEIITAAEANKIGWMPWAWDDNNLANCQANDNWFSMTYNCGVYVVPSDLTIYGKDVVLNPVFGIKVLAKPATSF
jgi:ribosomal protein L31